MSAPSGYDPWRAGDNGEPEAIYGGDGARMSHGCAVLKGRIYAAGGTDGGGVALKSMESYAPGDLGWRVEESMGYRRTAFGMAALGDRLFVAGENPLPVSCAQGVGYCASGFGCLPPVRILLYFLVLRE